MAKRAKAVDASFFSAQPLFLKPCSKEIYLAFIREHFPALEPMYRQRFESEAFVSAAYRKRIEALVKAVCVKYGLGRRSGDALLTRTVDDAGDDTKQPLEWPGVNSGLLSFQGRPTHLV
jgi:hypothetical protein